MNAPAPAWLRIVAALALFWNLFGVWAYLATVGVIPAASMDDMAPMPGWVTGAFAISVFAGALGCLGLLLLKRWAAWLLIVSLLAVLAQDVWAFFLRQGDDGNAALPIAVTAIAVLLAWLASHAVKRGWLR
jgi:uncharacterized membrane protein (DUF2068 family)